MSLYYNNFKYLDKNSMDQGLIVATFEPDDGFTDSFLSMSPIQEDYYDGTKKFDYGAKYNTIAVINITVIKNDGSDFSLADVRSLSKWLTGSRTNSWLDVGTSIDDVKYSFLGRVTNLQPRKMDGRIIGYLIEFSSVSPWAYSAPQSFDCSIGQLINVDSNGVVFAVQDNDSAFGVEDGVLYVNEHIGKNIDVSTSGVAYMDNMYRETIDNKSDDLYTYIYLDIDYTNQNGTYVSIKNATINEESTIRNISKNESITISAKQFIISDIPNKMFGDDFNFVWPRLQPGLNDFIIDGDGNGSAKFTYRYPMKVGDCAMDVDVSGSGIGCGVCPDDNNGVFTGTIAWDNITDIPTTIKGYGITDAYTMIEVDEKIENIESADCSCDTNINEQELNNMLADILG